MCACGERYRRSAMGRTRMTEQNPDPPVTTPEEPPPPPPAEPDAPDDGEAGEEEG